MGVPEEPEVKSKIASSSLWKLSASSHLMRVSAEKKREMSIQRLAEFWNLTRSCSKRIRSRMGGQGKSGQRRTKGSAVMNRSTSDCFIQLAIASAEAVKLKFTGIFPAKRQARFARIQPFPAGRIMPTRRRCVSVFRCLEKAMAAPSSW